MPDDPERPPWHTSNDLWEKLKPLARDKRTHPTEAEQWLWQHLRNRRLSGIRFRRQHSIGQFIVDFYCAEHDLVVEVDGPIHNEQQAEDQIRQNYLESIGLRVLRFTNDEVLNHIRTVLREITDVARR